MKLKTRAREEPEINLISLIDVVLMLVIFFMLSSQFVNEGRVRIQLPQASTVPSTRPNTGAVIVTITQQGSYRVNERELINSSPETLRAAVIKVAGSDRTARVTVRADARATHQAVITAMDVLGRLGFAEINVATVKDEAAAGKS
jgi:biopolymer transport protein ExbD